MKPELTFAFQIKVIVINEEWSEYGGDFGHIKAASGHRETFCI